MNIGDPDTPAVVIDLDIMERNLRPSAAMIKDFAKRFFGPGIQRAGGVKAALLSQIFRAAIQQRGWLRLLGNVSR